MRPGIIFRRLALGRESDSQRSELDAPKTDPTRQATQGSRNPALVGRTLAQIEKKAAAEGRTIVFIDESGFYLLAAAVYTWAPRGKTPILKYPMWEHLSVISAITPDGRLYTWVQDRSFKGEDIVRFLKHLLRCQARDKMSIYSRLRMSPK